MTDEQQGGGAQGESAGGAGDAEGAESRGVSRRTVVALSVGAGVALLAAGAAVVTPLLTGRGGLLGPAPTPTPTSTPSATLTVAHRGGSRDWPEMSMLGYANSAKLGAQALEISLARTKDGVWFGLHDPTLDRTSGTTGFVAADHTWQEVSQYRITAAQTTNPAQPAQPYLRFEELVDAFAASRVIYVDPKIVPAQHHPELFAMMSRVPAPTFVAKGYCTATGWAQEATRRGYRTWGYYYAADLHSDPHLLETTQSRWTTLGLDYTASPAVWKQVKAYGKPVLAHVVPDAEAAKSALQRGADGIVASGVREVLAEARG
jgi:Glycerophosphoryl diester phosphodiesterase family